MTQQLTEDWLVDCSLVTIMSNTMPPRDPTDDDDDEATTTKRTGTTNRRSSENLTNNAL